VWTNSQLQKNFLHTSLLFVPTSLVKSDFSRLAFVKIISRSLGLFGVLILLAFFQNCTSSTRFTALSSGFQKLQANLISFGNGQPYDGKPGVSFYQVVPNFECESSPSPAAILTVTSTGTFKYTFNQNDKCAKLDQISVDSSDVDVSNYNPKFVGYRDGIFEKFDSPPQISEKMNYSEAWCQPEAASVGDRYDVVIKYNSETKRAQAEIYFVGDGAVKAVSPFDVVRNIQLDNMNYSAPGFSLEIDRSVPAPQAWWFFPGNLKASIGNQTVAQKLICRVSAGKRLGTVSKVYSKTGQWNDYVKVTNQLMDGSHQTELACDGNEIQSSDCVHSALRLVIQTENEKCQGLTIEEKLGAFNWICSEEPSGATFYSTGLLQNKSLSTLIDFPNWRTNFITIRKFGVIQYQSLPLAWWSNSIKPLPDNSISGMTETLIGEGDIFVLEATRETAGYIMGSDKQSLLVVPGAELQSSALMPMNCSGPSLFTFGRCLISAQNRKFLWFEGALSNGSILGASDANLLLSFSSQNQIVNVSSKFARSSGVGLVLATNSIFSNIQATNNGKYGLFSKFSERNLFWNLTTANNLEAGVFLQSWDNKNSFIGLTTSNNTNYGMSATASDDLIIAHSRSEKNGWGGFDINASSGVFQKFFSVIAHNNNWGFWINGTSKGLFSNIAATNNVFKGLTVSGNTTGPTNHKFIDHLVFGGNGGKNCESFIFSPPDATGIEDNTCTDSGLDGSSIYSAQLSSAILNLSCIWDGGNFVMNCPLWSSQQPALIEDRACPDEAQGDQVIVDNKDVSHYYLKSAVEIPRNDGGNNNGLCESNETCLYLPPYSQLQTDRGPGLSQRCIFKDGLVKGVSLY
jgi:hypothetical protein